MLHLRGVPGIGEGGCRVRARRPGLLGGQVLSTEVVRVGSTCGCDDPNCGSPSHRGFGLHSDWRPCSAPAVTQIPVRVLESSEGRQAVSPHRVVTVPGCSSCSAWWAEVGPQVVRAPKGGRARLRRGSMFGSGEVLGLFLIGFALAVLLVAVVAERVHRAEPAAPAPAEGATW